MSLQSRILQPGGSAVFLVQNSQLGFFGLHEVIIDEVARPRLFVPLPSNPPCLTKLLGPGSIAQLTLQRQDNSASEVSGPCFRKKAEASEGCFVDHLVDLASLPSVLAEAERNGELGSQRGVYVTPGGPGQLLQWKGQAVRGQELGVLLA